MLWQRFKLYLLAFALYTVTAAVTAVLQALALHYESIAGLAPIIATLSGNFLGGFALVLGILRDDRAEKQRERADRAEDENKKLKQENEQYRQQYELAQQQCELAQQRAEQEREHAEQERARTKQERERAAQERARAERAEAELQRVRSDHDREIAERLRRLEAFAGLEPPEAADAASSHPTEQ